VQKKKIGYFKIADLHKN